MRVVVTDLSVACQEMYDNDILVTRWNREVKNFTYKKLHKILLSISTYFSSLFIDNLTSKPDSSTRENINKLCLSNRLTNRENVFFWRPKQKHSLFIEETHRNKKCANISTVGISELVSNCIAMILINIIPFTFDT